MRRAGGRAGPRGRPTREQTLDAARRRPCGGRGRAPAGGGTVRRAWSRAAADRREGLARLTGQVNSLRSRAEAAEAEIGRLSGARDRGGAAGRARPAGRSPSLETQVAGVDDGELGLDSEHEQALEAQGAASRPSSARCGRGAGGDAGAGGAGGPAGGPRRSVCPARTRPARCWRPPSAVPGSARLRRRPGHRAGRVRDGRGRRPRAAADAVAVTDVDAALGAVALLKTEDLGRAGLLLAGAGTGADAPMIARTGRACPTGPCTRSTWSRRPADIAGATRRLLRKIALVDDLAAARTLVDRLPDLTAVTTDGDLLSAALRGRRLERAAEPDRGAGRRRRRRAAAGRGAPPLRASPVRLRPSSRSGCG